MPRAKSPCVIPAGPMPPCKMTKRPIEWLKSHLEDGDIEPKEYRALKVLESIGYSVSLNKRWDCATNRGPALEVVSVDLVKKSALTRDRKGNVTSRRKTYPFEFI